MKIDEVFNDLIKFFNYESIDYGQDSFFENDEYAIYFWAYGERYSVRYADNEYIFRCEGYKSVNKLIETINKKCRGRDGKF